MILKINIIYKYYFINNFTNNFLYFFHWSIIYIHLCIWYKVDWTWNCILLTKFAGISVCAMHIEEGPKTWSSHTNSVRRNCLNTNYCGKLFDTRNPDRKRDFSQLAFCSSGLQRAAVFSPCVLLSWKYYTQVACWTLDLSFKLTLI